MIDLDDFTKQLDAEFERLLGGPVTEEAWNAMGHEERSRVMAARAAARWNVDFRYGVESFCAFTGLSRVEAMVYYFGQKSWDACTWITRLTPHQAEEKEPWQQ